MADHREGKASEERLRAHGERALRGDSSHLQLLVRGRGGKNTDLGYVTRDRTRWGGVREV